MSQDAVVRIAQLWTMDYMRIRFVGWLFIMVALMGCATVQPLAKSTAAPTMTATPVPALAGKWVMAGWDYSLTFAADGAVVRNVEGQNTPGTFKLSADGKRLLFVYTDGTNLDTRFTLSGESLILAMDDPQAGIKEPITLLRSQ